MPNPRVLLTQSVPLVVAFAASVLAPTARAAAPANPPEATVVRFSQIAEGLAAGSGQVEHYTVPAAGTASTGALQTSQGAGTAAAAPPAPAIAPGEALGAQRTLVSLVNFTNDPSTPWLVADVESEILDPNTAESAAAYVLEASYGRAWLTGSAVDWFFASYDDSSCGLPQPGNTQQLIDELDPTTDFSAIDRWIIVVPYNASCGFVGVSTLGKWTFDSDEGVVTFSRTIVNGTPMPLGLLVAHELGHSFVGLQHSLDHECGAETVGAGCAGVPNDRYDVMADVSGGGHFTPPGKAALEWFDGDLVDVAPPGGTFLLEPYEATSAGVKVLRIQAPWYTDDLSEGKNYYVSYRKPVGFDQYFTELATDGAMLHLDAHYFPEFSSVATAPSRLLDASPDATSPQTLDSSDVLLETGETFVDTLHGITIETLGMVGGSLEVSVTIDQYCGNGVQDDGFDEQCDGIDLGGASCASIGRTGGTLACTPSCTFDTATCGAAQCAPGDTFDEATGRCTAMLFSVAPHDMSVYKNAATWTDARNATLATLLTQARGFMASVQNLPGSGRSILHRTLLPFDTSPLPDGATLTGATLHLKLESYPPINNTHPNSGDQLVLVQTNDPTPTVRERSDFGAFVPIDAPDEGAPRIDVSDTLVDLAAFSFELDATGLSWIDDTGYTKLGMRSAYDVDDVTHGTDYVDLRLGVVPTDSPIAGPRLEVEYIPVPEPGAALGLLSCGSLLTWLARRRRGTG